LSILAGMRAGTVMGGLLLPAAALVAGGMLGAGALDGAVDLQGYPGWLSDGVRGEGTLVHCRTLRSEIDRKFRETAASCGNPTESAARAARRPTASSARPLITSEETGRIIRDLSRELGALEQRFSSFRRGHRAALHPLGSGGFRVGPSAGCLPQRG
jgi:hypothetical protein